MSRNEHGSEPYGDLGVARRRGPRPLAAALRRLRGATAPATLLAAAQQVWEEAVGARIAAQCEPVSEHDGALVLSCESAVWAAELELMSRDLLERLNSSLPEGSEAAGFRFVTRPK